MFSFKSTYQIHLNSEQLHVRRNISGITRQRKKIGDERQETSGMKNVFSPTVEQAKDKTNLRYIINNIIKIIHTGTNTLFLK